MSYLNLAAFRLRTIMPKVDIDVVEADTPGYTDARLATHASRIDSRLRKRYKVPFATPYPEIVLDWLTKLVTWDLYLKRGVDPQDQSIAHVRDDRQQTLDELKEAADAKDGLFDLPLDDSKDDSAVTKAGPLGYTEQSPYVWTTLQRADGVADDQSGSGK